jgi:DNA-directed RNA polymerase subunit RPC12/RpoP
MDLPTLLALLGVIIALAGGGYLLYRWKSQNRPDPDEYYHFRCPGCKRRLRYRAIQVGRKGKCSNCGGIVIFPPLSQAID